MAILRSRLVDESASGFYHCMSRCVRGAHLCGGDWEYRREWIHERLIELSGIFASDVAAFAVMSNHLHVIVRTNPEIAAMWSGHEVVSRWSRLFPASVLARAQEFGARTGRTIRARGAGSGMTIDPRELSAAIKLLASNQRYVTQIRRRLSSLSWFMKCLKEPIARRANREDDHPGAFWEGRFKSPRLLDDAAVLFGMVYVDLNLVRAALASTPEGSDHTSIQDRIHVLQLFEKEQGRRVRAPKRSSRLRTRLGRREKARGVEDGHWLAPIEQRGEQRREQSRCGLLGMRLVDYVKLVDVTGRIVDARKPGSIPPELPPILERLGLDAGRWTELWGQAIALVGTAIGGAAARAVEARRRGTRWVVGKPEISRISVSS